MKVKNPVASERRRFLKGMAAAGGTAALAAMTHEATSGENEATSGEAPGKRSKGYRLTAHIRDYYRSLRI